MTTATVSAATVKEIAESNVDADYQLGNEPWYDVGQEPSPNPLASDCSGEIYGVFRKAGVTVNGRPLERLTADAYWHMTTPLAYPGPFRCGDLGFLVKDGHCYHTFLVVDSQGTVVEAGFGGKVRETTVKVENARPGIRWGRWNTNIVEEENMPVDTVSDALAQAAVQKLVAAGIVTKPEAHKLTDAASVGLLWVVIARLLEKQT